MNTFADEEQTIATPGVISRKQIIAAVIFFAFAVYLATVVPSIEIAWATALLVLGPEEGFRLAEREQLSALFLIRGEDGFMTRQTFAFRQSDSGRPD